MLAWLIHAAASCRTDANDGSSRNGYARSQHRSCIQCHSFAERSAQRHGQSISRSSVPRHGE
jgi:hypothetical protein